MKGEIVSVGTELLLGHLVDTNAPFLAQSLSTLGIDVFWISQVGDNLDRLVETLRRGLERSDLIVMSGGMGPTGDDLTREAIAESLGEQMVVQPQLEANLRAFFARRSRAMPERNVKQATLIPSASAIPNPIGTAPGWLVEKGGHLIVAMPGVPVEMMRMWEQEVVPQLSRLAGSGIILSRTLKTLGIGESAVEDDLRELTLSTNPTVATYAKQDGVHVRISAKAERREDAEEKVAEMETRVRRILGDHVYGADDETIPDVLAALLRERGITLATLEACTAGQLSTTLASSPAAAETFRGGLVAYQTDLLPRFGVRPELVAARGALSVEVVRAMATAARDMLQANVGLAAVCGAEEDSAGQSRLLVVHGAVDLDGFVSTVTNHYSTTHRDVRRRAVLDAMDLLRRQLLATRA